MNEPLTGIRIIGIGTPIATPFAARPIAGETLAVR
jgi:hypothetical protein